MNTIKGTVCVKISNPPCKDENARFTTVPLKLLSNQKCGRYRLFLTRKVFNFDVFSSASNKQERHKIEDIKFILYQTKILRVLLYQILSLPLEITLTVPLKMWNWKTTVQFLLYGAISNPINMKHISLSIRNILSIEQH